MNILYIIGWVQELDGDPGEISAWYRGQTNIEKTSSNSTEGTEISIL